MKHLFFITMLAALSACSLSSKTVSNPNAIKGKLVVKELCAHFVVTVQAGTIDTSKVAATWTDAKRNLTYSNAFTVATRCSFGLSGLNEGDSFTFELADSNLVENCAVCLAFYPTPNRALAIKNIKKINP